MATIDLNVFLHCAKCASQLGMHPPPGCVDGHCASPGVYKNQAYFGSWIIGWPIRLFVERSVEGEQGIEHTYPFGEGNGFLAVGRASFKVAGEGGLGE